MYKYIATAIVIIGFVFAIMNSKINSLTKENILLKTQIKECINGMEKRIESDKRANETIEKVRTIVRTVKVDDCNCYNSVLPDKLQPYARGK